MSFVVNTFQQYSNDYGLGNNGVKICLNYFDGIPDQSLINSLPSPELKLAIKSLLKRDDTTKERAINDLLKLIDNTGKDEIHFDNDVFLLCWSQLYSKLVSNQSKVIRLGSHHLTTELIKLLGKRITKFLKDFVPLLLSGSYDFDASVAKGCQDDILKCFNKDPKKVAALWTVFRDQTLTFVKEVVVAENQNTISDDKYVPPEEAEIKYNHLITSAILTLIRLISDEKNSDLFEANTLYDILICEDLWRYFNLKKTNNLKTFQALLQLLDTLTGNEYIKNHNEILKLASKRLFKSMAQISSRNSLMISPLFPQILSTLIHLSEYSGAKFWTFDRSSKDKLIHFLSQGPGNADPSYYCLKYTLYRQTNAPLDLHDWLLLWQGDIQIESKRRVFTKNVEKLLSECWKYYLKIIEDGALSMDGDKESNIQQQIIETLNRKPLNENSHLTSLFASFLSFEMLIGEMKRLLPEGKNEQHQNFVYFDNLIILLIKKPGNREPLKQLATLILESINQCTEYDAHYGFRIYDLFINREIMFLQDEVSKFIYELPTFISESFYEIPAKIMVHYSSSAYRKNSSIDTWLRYYDDFLIIILGIPIPQNFLISVFNELDDEVFETLMEQSRDLRTFVSQYVDSYDFSDNLIFKSRLIGSGILIDLYHRALQVDRFDEFSRNCVRLSESDYLPFFESTDFLAKAMFADDENIYSNLKDIVVTLCKSNDKIAEKASMAILAHVDRSSNPVDSAAIAYSIDLIQANPNVSNYLYPRDPYKELDKYVTSISYQVALCNPLGLNTHFVHVSSNDFEFDSIRKLVCRGLFLDSLMESIPELSDDNRILYLTILAECATDYNSLSPDPLDYMQNFKNTIFQHKKVTFEFADIVKTVIDRSSAPTFLLEQLTSMDGHSEVVSFYKCRTLHRILSNAVDYVSSSSFDKIVSIDDYISKLVRDKDRQGREFLVASTLLSSFSKFNGVGNTLTKVRTLLASEMIGVKGREMVERTPKAVILLNNMLRVDNDAAFAEDFTPISPQRLRMILNEIGRWFDSDLYYDDSFALARLALLQFFQLILKFPTIISMESLIFEPYIRLLSDSLDMCLIEETPFLQELIMISVQCYKQLGDLVEEGTLDKDLWIENNDSMEKSFIEMCFGVFGSRPSNMCSFLFYQIAGTVISEIPTQVLQHYYEDLLTKFISKSINNIDQLRIIVSVLRKLILSRQQELLIEYELQKSSGTSEPNEEKLFKIPEGLLKVLNQNIPDDYLEYEDEVNFIRYLWSCFLTHSFFEDMSYNIRQGYIEQLKENDTLFKLFDFFSDQVDLMDHHFWNMVPETDILHYQVQDPSHTYFKEDILNESKKLLLHLMYVFFNSVGSATSTWWLNIKDRSRQLKIEKFVSRYISPILIRHELAEVASKVKRLTSQDQSLTIKINNVTNEIKAGYLVDEQTLEIVFKLPANYPLNNIQVQGISRVGINEQKWKSWILSTQRVITGMNGSVVDSLELFTKNANLHFSGFEECAICYSILHAVDRKLPSKTCPTCNNRFHGACLYKWFRSSGNNTCPMCRGEIPFRK